MGDTRTYAAVRARQVLTGPVHDQVARLVALLADRGALADGATTRQAVAVPESRPNPIGPVVAVLVEPDREHLSRELLTAAAGLACQLDGRVVAMGPGLPDGEVLGSWGADTAISITGSDIEEDIADAVTRWAGRSHPSIMLAPSTAWGREVASRVAAARGAGLVGDAVAVELSAGRLIAWKPAFGGQLVAAISTTTPLQMATIRAGALPMGVPRTATAEVHPHLARPRGGIRVHSRDRDDDLDTLAEADVMIGIGSAVPGDEHPLLTPLVKALNAQLTATRKVTDRGELPRARQIGITGRSVAPRLYIALGVSGKFDHTVGIQRSHTVVAVNTDPTAPIFQVADIGLVADWREVADALPSALEASCGA